MEIFLPKIHSYSRPCELFFFKVPGKSIRIKIQTTILELWFRKHSKSCIIVISDIWNDLKYDRQTSMGGTS